MSFPSKAFWIAVAAILLSISTPAEAKITIEPDFQGTLLVTFPDGKVQMYDAGEALPDIPSGATIEVFGGKVSLSTGDGESLKLSCLGSEASVGGGSSASLGCGESEGTLSVDKGSASVTQTDGSEKIIAEGEEYPIKAKDEEAAPTSEGDELGTTVDQTDPPDSRNLEASPAQ